MVNSKIKFTSINTGKDFSLPEQSLIVCGIRYTQVGKAGKKRENREKRQTDRDRDRTKR